MICPRCQGELFEVVKQEWLSIIAREVKASNLIRVSLYDQMKQGGRIPLFEIFD
jgi:hypothetical protein